jgi:hypothetical protein
MKILEGDCMRRECERNNAVKILLCEKNGNQSLKNGRTASLG